MATQNFQNVDIGGTLVVDNNFTLSGSAQADIDLNTQMITNLGAPANDNDAARKVYVDNEITSAINNLVDSAPEALNTLKEIADAINDDANIADTLTSLSNDVSNNLAALQGHFDNMVTLTGVGEDSTDLGTFSGSTITDNTTIQQALQDLETELETTFGKADDLISLTGVNANATDLGTFSGSTITDNTTIQQALQDLETELENTTSSALPLAGGSMTGTIDMFSNDISGVGFFNFDEDAAFKHSIELTFDNTGSGPDGLTSLDNSTADDFNGTTGRTVYNYSFSDVNKWRCLVRGANNNILEWQYNKGSDNDTNADWVVASSLTAPTT